MSKCRNSLFSSRDVFCHRSSTEGILNPKFCPVYRRLLLVLEDLDRGHFAIYLSSSLPGWNLLSAQSCCRAVLSSKDLLCMTLEKGLFDGVIWKYCLGLSYYVQALKRRFRWQFMAQQALRRYCLWLSKETGKLAWKELVTITTISSSTAR